MTTAIWVKAKPPRTDLPRPVSVADFARFKQLWHDVDDGEALECADETCTVNVYASYGVNGGPGRFSKCPPAAGKDREHSDTCLFNVERQLAAIAQRSLGHFVDASTASQARYVLTVPSDMCPPGNAAGHGPVEGRRRPIRRRSAVVLNTAAQVALLLARYRAVGADPDVEFTATFRGRTISWSDFFYPPDRIGELRARLAAGTLDHPAVVLTDGHSRTDRASTPPQWHSFIPRGVRENMLFIRPEDEARTRMAQEIDQAPADGWWILFGQWFLAKPASEDHDARLTIAKVTIQQIIELDRKSSAAARRRWPLPPPARRHYRRRP